MSFQDALDVASEQGQLLDRNRGNKVVAMRFHAAWLNVRRTIHRDFPDCYGDPDDIADPQTIELADAMLDEA